MVPFQFSICLWMMLLFQFSITSSLKIDFVTLILWWLDFKFSIFNAVDNPSGLNEETSTGHLALDLITGFLFIWPYPFPLILLKYVKERHLCGVFVLSGVWKFPKVHLHFLCPPLRCQKCRLSFFWRISRWSSYVVTSSVIFRFKVVKVYGKQMVQLGRHQLGRL